MRRLVRRGQLITFKEHTAASHRMFKPLVFNPYVDKTSILSNCDASDFKKCIVQLEDSGIEAQLVCYIALDSPCAL